MKIGKVIVGVMLLVGTTTVSMAVAPEAAFKRCIVCHGKSAEKIPPGGTIVSATLSADEIKRTMKLYKTDKNHGGKMKISMQLQVKSLSDGDIDALADYIFKNFHIAK